MTNKETAQNTKLKRELGLGAAIAIIVGNMIGSGIFTSAQSLAQVANPMTTILAWIITGGGSVLLALSFARLGTLFPETGGPIVYTEKAFGKFTAYLVAWTFWVGSWIGNAAIITAVLRYLTVFFPRIANDNLLSFVIASAILWLFTWINIRGVKYAGHFSMVSTVLKLGVIIIFVIIAFYGFNGEYLHTYSSPEVQGLGSLPAAISVTLWSFVGLESASVSGGEIKNPEVNIKRSTVIGTVTAVAIYLIISVLSMGGLPQDELAQSQAPLAGIINHITGGTWGGSFIALGVIIAVLGTISGWVLITARLSFAAGEDGLFPDFFAKVHKKYATPYSSLIITGIFTNLLLILNYVQSLTQAFNFMVTLATLSFIPAYALTTVAEIILTAKSNESYTFMKFMKKHGLSMVAFFYAIYIIYATGAEVAMWVFLLMFLGIPFYVYQRLKNQKE